MVGGEQGRGLEMFAGWRGEEGMGREKGEGERRRMRVKGRGKEDEGRGEKVMRGRKNGKM